MGGQSHTRLLERYWANTRMCHHRTNSPGGDFSELGTEEPSADEEEVDADKNENEKPWSDVDRSESLR